MSVHGSSGKILRILAGVVVLLLPGAAQAFEVLGCSLRAGENPDGFIRCVQGAADQRVTDARNDAKRQLDDERKKSSQRITDLEAALPKGPAEVRTLEAVRKLNLAPLFDCLDAAGASGQLRDDVARMAGDPGAAAKVLFERSWAKLESQLDGLLAADVATLGSLGPAPDASGAPARALQRFQTLVAQDPVLACVARHLGGRAAGVQQAGKDLAAEVQQRATALFAQKVRPLIQKAALKALDTVLAKAMAQVGPRGAGRADVSGRSATRSSALEASGATSTGGSGTAPAAASGSGGGGAKPPAWADVLKIDPESIATRAYIAGVLLPRIEKISARLDALNRDLANHADTTLSAKALRDAYADDPGTTAVVEMEIGLGIIKAIGANYLEYDGMIFGIPGGGVLWDGFYEAFSLAMYVGYDVLDGSGGLIPEIGAYACAVVIAILQATEKEPGGAYAKAAVKWLMLHGLAAAWGSLVDNVGAEIIKAGGAYANGEMARLKAGDPAFAFLVDRLQPEAIRLLGAGYLDRLKASTAAYDAGVQTMLGAFIPR